ncbi:MAG: cell division protein SepF [Actinomyces sp.]|nr:cell division protein SepF [Actinomyces sp.]
MAGSFGSRARKFMGWYSPEDMDPEFDGYDGYELEEEMPDRTDLAPIESPTVTPLHREGESRRTAGADLTRIVTVHPGSYNDALPIGESFRKGIPVIINLTEMSEVEARRVIDFAAGLTFGLHGVIERVTNRVFLLSPRTVEVTGDVTGSRRGALFNQG